MSKVTLVTIIKAFQFALMLFSMLKLHMCLNLFFLWSVIGSLILLKKIYVALKVESFALSIFKEKRKGISWIVEAFSLRIGLLKCCKSWKSKEKKKMLKNGNAKAINSEWHSSYLLVTIIVITVNIFMIIIKFYMNV